jgi:hypothetical protein
LDENWKRSATTPATKRRHCGTEGIGNLSLLSPISTSTLQLHYIEYAMDVAFLPQIGVPT